MMSLAGHGTDGNEGSADSVQQAIRDAVLEASFGDGTRNGDSIEAAAESLGVKKATKLPQVKRNNTARLRRSSQTREGIVFQPSKGTNSIELARKSSNAGNKSTGNSPVAIGRKASLKRSATLDDLESVKPTLIKQLRSLYDTRDAESIGHDDGDVDESLYTDLALLKRESIRLEPNIQIVLGELFEACDTDLSGKIDRSEYRKLMLSLYDCLRFFWDETMPEVGSSP
jgi:hypothetical protein